MPNRLAQETSPYLLQHAHNPVDWFPWGDAAFAKARIEDKPIIVSIGYSTCHWCHVMERESFEDARVAAFMNAHFVNIKVDREERPDVDAVYMEAVQVLSGSGGWPLNCFLMPDGRPFFGGTYYPPQQAHGRPSWGQVLMNMQRAFSERREEVEAQANRLMGYIATGDEAFVNRFRNEATAGGPQPVLLQNIFHTMQERFDREHGGFGGAPKFPGAMQLAYLLEYAHHLRDERASQHVHRSLEKMIYGGIYDQLGGGFARYATDAAWLVPHFEKMLYDNALLIGLLADAWRFDAKPLYRDTVAESLGFVARELSAPEGGFYSALDADSEGEEGKFYVWSASEIEALLGADAALFMAYYGASAEGNWEGHNILHRRQDEASFAAEQGQPLATVRDILAEGRKKLLAHRALRVRPGLDDKCILGWNALMITACYKAYKAFGEPAYADMARRALAFVRTHMADGEGYFHVWAKGRCQYAAYLDDYAFLIEALLEAYTAEGDLGHLEEAEHLARYVLAHFADAGGGLCYYTSDAVQDLPLRRKDYYDASVPSGNSTLANSLYLLSFYTGDASFGQWAARAWELMQAAVERHPASFGRWAQGLVWQVFPPAELAIIGPEAEAWAFDVQAWPIAQVVLMRHAAPLAGYPLMAGRTVPEGHTYIYVCRDFACQAPVDTLAAARQLLLGVEKS